MIKAVISDFGGVVTLPLFEGFKRAHEELGVPIEALGVAMKLTAARNPEPPLWTLERGQMTEADFLAGLEAALTEVTGTAVTLDGYGALLMGKLEPNEPLLARYRELREAGVRLAILTNNVREWHDIWRTAFDIDALFELVVDSAFEGTRKPEPRIYELTLSRLGLAPPDCVFIDDVEVNVTAANELGLHGIHFRDTDQVLAELDAALDGAAP
ncbi:HAD family hydrolase [Solirubrobacter soli]|uniref:HAD family hydrolase n=1 Tax=Solirubrobacter soli TaxID=363832 RepID=UPI0004163383|nr:HAD family phosphatase [Solirubrobacter soli]